MPSAARERYWPQDPAYSAHSDRYCPPAGMRATEPPLGGFIQISRYPFIYQPEKPVAVGAQRTLCCREVLPIGASR
jgi:hypothetical protein